MGFRRRTPAPAHGRGAERAPRVLGVTLALVPGAMLGVAALVAAGRRRSKPLHPVGVGGEGRLTITHPLPEFGVPLLDRTGEHRCLVRWSRAVGVPADRRDIEGLALRLPDQGGRVGADLLLASTGTGPVTRFVLVFRRPRRHGPVTTLLPVRTSGPDLLLGLVPDPRTRTTRGAGGAEDAARGPRPADPRVPGGPPTTYDVVAARPRGPWRTVGVLELEWSVHDVAARLDPVRHPLPGTRQHGAVAVLRAPAYIGARLGFRHRRSS